MKAAAPPTPGGFCLFSGLFLGFYRVTIYAAVSRYSSGSLSNSFLQSSEQKKYFLPANIVWNSDSCSSILIPQTGSVVMYPLLWEKLFPQLPPDSNDSSVLCHLP